MSKMAISAVCPTCDGIRLAAAVHILKRFHHCMVTCIKQMYAACMKASSWCVAGQYQQRCRGVSNREWCTCFHSSARQCKQADDQASKVKVQLRN